VRRIGLALALLAASTILSSCVEDVSPGSNNPPKVWFTRAPKEGREIFTNAFEFWWTATDTDDDLGMGQTYVTVVPAKVDTFVVSPRTLADGALASVYPAAAFQRGQSAGYRLHLQRHSDRRGAEGPRGSIAHSQSGSIICHQ